MSKRDREIAALLDRQREAFVAKFGRQPGPNDPVFFDRDATDPRRMCSQLVHETLTDAFREAGVAPEWIYAYQETGRIVTAQNWDLLEPDAQNEWNAAVDEYFRLEHAAENAPRT